MGRSRRKKTVGENEKEQSIDKNADKCWREDALRAVFANAKQGNDS